MDAMLIFVNEYIGYNKYRIRANNELYKIDVYDKSGNIIIYAERMGTRQEIYNYIAGMYQIAYMGRNK